MSLIVNLADYRRLKGHVYFARPELSRLMSLYSTCVASGEWRDYAIDHETGMAVFSIFRHAHETPVFAIAKTVSMRGVEYTVYDHAHRLYRATTLDEVLERLAKRLKRLRVVT
ncbi:MAG: DUF2794 domain-containing protein [Azospirillaceae bacterium]